MASSFHHIFFLKKPKNYFKGPIVVYLRITVSGNRTEISINRKVDPAKWQINPGRMKGRGARVKEFNSYPLSIEIKLYDAYRHLILEKDMLTVAALKNRYNGISNKQRMLVPIFQKHNTEVAVLVPKDYSLGTLDKI